MYDFVIIGGGPAGITAGIYAARQKLNTLLITKDFGGQINWKAVNIENYPGFEEISGMDLTKKFENHLKKHNVEIQKEEVRKIEKKENYFLIQTKNGNIFNSKAVLVASGAEHCSLGVSGEKEFLGKGVSYCTVCDAPMFANKNVAVVGGGNAGFEAAITLTKWTKKVYILEKTDQIKADIENQKKAEKTGRVEIITDSQVEEIKGENFVNSLDYFKKNTGEKINLPVEGVFVAIGTRPAIDFVKGLVDLNEKNEIKIDFSNCQSSCPGLFAAGDASSVACKQIIVAAGEGAKAALSAYYYLQK